MAKRELALSAREPAAGWAAFISYTRREPDLSKAIAIEEALRRARLAPWRDENNIDAGDRFFNEIVSALESSQCVVAILSGQSLAKQWVLGEVFTALAFQKLVPVILEPVGALPFGIGETIQFASADSIDRIVAAVRKQGRIESTGRFLRSPARPWPHGTVGVAEALTWWPAEPSTVVKLQADLRKAGELFASSRRSAIRSAYTSYCRPPEIGAALIELRRALEVKGSTEEWQALGYLALPFSQNIAMAAFERGTSHDAEIERATGLSIADIRREFTAPAIELARGNATTMRQPEAAPPLAPVAAPVQVPPATLLPKRPSSIGRSQEAQAHSQAAIETPPSPPQTIRLPGLAGWIGIGIASVAVAVAVVWWWLGRTQPTSSPPPTDAPAEISAPPADTPPLVGIAYCNDLQCRFPSDYSFARVARECYEDEGAWLEIWRENRTNFPDRDPNRVYAGEEFSLPWPCKPKP